MQTLMVFLVLGVVFSTMLLGFLLDSVLTLVTGVRLAFDLPPSWRLFGAIPIFVGLSVIGDTLRYRKPRDVLVSTSVTLLKFLRREPLGVQGARTEPFVPNGSYRWVRNPMYFGAIMLPFGLGVTLSSTPLVLWGVVLVLWFLFLIPHEEKELEALFGESYAEYKHQVPMLFPTGRRYKVNVSG